MHTVPQVPDVWPVDTLCVDHSQTLYRSPVFGLCLVCCYCGLVLRVESDDPESFRDAFGYVLAYPDRDGHDGCPVVPSRAARRGSVLRARDRARRGGAPALRAARRVPSALADSLLASVGIWRW